MYKLFCFVAIAAAFAAGPAQADYPDRSVKIVVPFPAGQTTDLMAREIAQQFTSSFGQPFFVDNRGGAGGIIGMENAKRSDPDGYTLVMASSGPLAINPSLYKSLSYDTLADFEPVSTVVTVPLFLVVRKDFPANTLAEFIAYVKKHPGKLNYGSGGTGLTNHLVMEMLKTKAGLDIVHVPYRGAAAAVTALIAGDIGMMFEAAPPILSHVQSNNLKLLAVGSQAGAKAFPKVPSVSTEVPGFDAQAWVALMAPKGTGPDITGRLSQAMRTALHAPGVEDKFAGLGAEVATMAPEQTKAFIQSEMENWKAAVIASNARLD